MAKSRKSAQKRKEEREKQRRRNRQLTIVGVVVGTVVLLGALFLLSNLPTDAPIGADVAERYDGFLQGTTEDGYPRLGNPDAPVLIEEFSSFSCPACGTFHSNVFPTILQEVREGRAQFVFVPMLTGSIPNPVGAAKAALCAGEQGQFWEMHDVLFDWQATFVNTAFSGNRLTSGAEALGLDMGEFNSCFDSARINTVLDNAQAEGVGATPTVRINGTVLDSASSQAILQRIEDLGPFPNVEPGVVSDEG